MNTIKNNRFAKLFFSCLIVSATFAAVTRPMHASIQYGKAEFGQHSITHSFYGPLILGFGSNHTIKLFDQKVHLQPELILPVTLLGDFSSAKINLGISSVVYSKEIWGIGATADLSLASGENSMGSLYAPGFSLGLQPGIYKDKWYAAFDFRYSNTPVVYLKHSDYMKNFFTDIPGVNPPENGWYLSGNSRYAVGLTGGYTFSKKLSVTGSIGALLISQKQNIVSFAMAGIVPIYMPVNLTYHF